MGAALLSWSAQVNGIVVLSGRCAAVSHRELTTVATTMTTVRLPDTPTYATVELASCLVTPTA
jgi:hypothetical protein